MTKLTVANLHVLPSPSGLLVPVTTLEDYDDDYSQPGSVHGDELSFDLDLPGGTSTFLRADGAWASPGGGSGAADDGWVDAAETWTYASADAPTFTFTVSGDQTGKYSPGMRVRLVQTTTKYFIVTVVAHAGGTTTITIYGGTDYTLANAAITSPFYSTAKAPQGFPLSPVKWTVKVTSTADDAQANPAQNTFYNLGSRNIVIPIGAWHVDMQVLLDFNRSAGGPCFGRIGLSTSTSSFTDLELIGGSWAVDSGTPRSIAQVNRHKQLVLATKTTYHLVATINTTGGLSLDARGDLATTVLRATSAYL